MGFREKVTLSLVIVIFLQITCRHCMPSTPRKSTLNAYPNNYKSINPKPSIYSPTKPKASKLGKQQNSKPYKPLQNKFLYKTYNFPENEYPLDNSPKDTFNFGKNYNAYKVNTPRKNAAPSNINNLKREMKMKRKLNNRQLNFENPKQKNEIDSAVDKCTSDTQPRVLGPGSFPDVQYPTSVMETWGPNYWSYFPLTQNEQKAMKPKSYEPTSYSKSLKKSLANQFLKPYDKLKEEREYFKASFKRKNPFGKAFNFTKTATSERNSEELITTGLIYSIPSNSTDKNMNTADPIPLQTAEIDNEPVNQTSIDPDQTQENLSNYTQNVSLEPTINTYDDINNDVPLSRDTPTNVNRANSTEDEPTDKLIIPITNDANDPNTTSGFVQNNIPSTVSQNPDNVPNNNDSPLSFEIPIDSPISNDNLNNIISSPPLRNGNAGSGTSIIIIPINNGVNNLQSDSPIVLYIPTNLPRDTPAPNQPQNDNSPETVSDTSNNTTLSPCSNITQTLVDNPTADAFVSELPLLNGASSNYVTKSDSQLPIFETLPRNSMCYNNANTPSSFVEDSSLSNPISQEPISSLQSVNQSTENDTMNEGQLEVQDTKTEDKTSLDLPDLNLPLIDLSLLSDELNKKDQNDEGPKTVQEISSDTSKFDITNPDTDLGIPTEKEPSETKDMGSNTPQDSQDSNKMVDKSVLVKDAIKNATLTLFPTDKPSQAVYDAVLNVLISNTTISSMLINKKQPDGPLLKQNKTTDGTNVDFVPVDETAELSPASNVTSMDILPQPVNQSSTSSQETVISKETDNNSLPIPIESTLVPISPSGLGTNGSIGDETIMANQSKESNNNMPLSEDITLMSENKTLEPNITPNTNNDLLKTNGSLMDNTENGPLLDAVQDVPVPTDESVNPASMNSIAPSDPFNNFDNTIDTEPLINDEVQKTLDDTVVDNINVKDDSDDQNSKDFTGNWPSQMESNINRNSTTDNVTSSETEDNSFSSPLGIQVIPDDTAVDTFEDLEIKDDGLPLSNDQKDTELLSNIPTNDNIPPDRLQALDEPELKDYEDSYEPSDKQQFFKESVSPLENSSADYDSAIQDQPSNSDSEVSLPTDELNSSPEIIEDKRSSDNEYIEKDKLSADYIDDIDSLDQPSNGDDTFNDSKAVLLDDSTQPMDEIVQSTPLLDNYSNYLIDPNANLASQANSVQTNASPVSTDDLNSSLDPITSDPITSKSDSPAANRIPDSSKTNEKNIYSPEMKEKDKWKNELDDKTQQVQENVKTKKRHLPPSNKPLLNFFDLLNETIEDDEEIESSDPDNSTEDLDSFTNIKPHVPMSLPMAKAILEDVLFNIYRGGLTIAAPKVERKPKQHKLTNRIREHKNW